MVEIGKLLLNWILALWKGRADLALENLALRHQVLILERGRKKPRATESDRLIWIVLSKVWGGWQEALHVFQPRTVVGWSRNVFSRLWAWISRAEGGRPRIERETVELIRQMWNENPTWGAPRIRRELLKLGVKVSQSTVQKYRPRWKGPRDQKWTTFLRNHLNSVAAVDFFTVPTVTCRILYVFVILHHDRRRVLHFNVTDSPSALRDDVVHDVAVNVRQAELAPLMAIGQSFVIDAKEVEAGGVEVVDVDFVFDNTETKLISGAMGRSSFDAATGHPNAEALLMVIAAWGGFRSCAGVVLLNHGRAAKFASPYHQGIVQHASLLQILDQARTSLVDIAGRFWERVVNVRVMIPSLCENLNKPHSLFNQPPSEEAVACKIGFGGVALIVVQPVLPQDVFGFSVEINKVRHGGLHAEGKFVLGDAGGDLRVAVAFERLSVETLNRVDYVTSFFPRGALRAIDEEDGLFALSELHALMPRRKKSAAPDRRSSCRRAVLQNDVSGQILVFCS